MLLQVHRCLQRGSPDSTTFGNISIHIVGDLTTPTLLSHCQATQYGINTETTAIAAYTMYQHEYGHPDLTVSPSRFIVCSTHSFLGVNPDGAVYDPSSITQPFGFLEIECPFLARNIFPQEACTNPRFCCTTDQNGYLLLKENHAYYSQVQGQMTVGGRPWCDSVIYTCKGILIHRTDFDENFWKDKLLPKLKKFYDNCVAPEIVSPSPEIVSPVHALGIPIRDLSKKLRGT